MTAYLIIVLALCALFTLCLAKAASRESRARERAVEALNTGEIAVKFEWDGDTVTAVYVYESKATRTSGCVWKYECTGPQFSSTGFDGPYKKVEAMLP